MKKFLACLIVSVAVRVDAYQRLKLTKKLRPLLGEIYYRAISGVFKHRIIWG
jgi:hypothetical protein